MSANLRAHLENPNLLSARQLQLLQFVAQEAGARKISAYLVGGFVRDLLLEKPVNDFDVVIEGDGIAFAHWLAKTHGGKVTAHAKFGTAKWFLDPDEDAASFLDLITARSEIYKSPAALPTVKFSNLADDIRRRDFTINTLAIRLDGNHFGEVRDDLHAQADLKDGTIRVLHPKSFIDDPTRMYRAVRYEVRYGFQIEAETLALVPKARHLVEKLSAQRIRHEFDLILDEEQAASMLARLADLDLLKVVHSELPNFNVHYSGFLNVEPSEELGVSYDRVTQGYLLWLGELPVASINALAKRLAFTADLKRALISASTLLADLPAFADSKPSQWTARLDSNPLIAIYVASLITDDTSRVALQSYLAIWRHMKPFATGDELRKLGLEPGPKYQVILSRLRNAWLDGDIKTQQDENSLLEKLTGS